MTRFACAGVLAVLLVAPGCASIENLVGDHRRPFGGLRSSFADEPHWFRLPWILELDTPYPLGVAIACAPLHLAVDLALLPVTLVSGCDDHDLMDWWPPKPEPLSPPRRSSSPSRRVRPAPRPAPAQWSWSPPRQLPGTPLRALPRRYYLGFAELSANVAPGIGRQTTRFILRNLGDRAVHDVRFAVRYQEVTLPHTAVESVTIEGGVDLILRGQTFEHELPYPPRRVRVWIEELTSNGLAFSSASTPQ